ncbi:MAG: hypothetical protein AB8F74_21330 [Saprospiraceae bacterium]
MIDKKPIIFTILLLLLLLLAAIVAKPLFLIICVVLLFVYIYKFTSFGEMGDSENIFRGGSSLENIRQSLEDVQFQISKLGSDVLNIQGEINDLEVQLATEEALRPEAIAESRILISRFEEQLALRKTKIAFYKTCQQKIKNLQANHLLAKKLAEKQKKLQQLQENEYEEVASKETLRTILKEEVRYLEAIDQLTYRMKNCQSIEEAEDIERELLLVTEALRKL